MITAQPLQRTRPYWFMEMKWLCGALLFVSLGACLLLYNLAAITERPLAVGVSTNIITNVVSDSILGNKNALAELQQQAASLPGDIVAPLGALPSIRITKEQIASLNQDSLRQIISSQLTGPLYDKGVKDAAKQISPDPAVQQQITKQAGFLDFFSKPSHDMMQRLFVMSACVSAVFAALLIYFSSGWGRLAVPGFVLLAVSPVGAIAGLVLVKIPVANSPLGAVISQSVAAEIGKALCHSYLYTLIAGAALLLIALLGRIIQSLVKRTRSGASKPATTATN